ncbi:MAG: GPR endopeptidase [Clostridium sp.]|nr:GPR endopeptidase [Clostridium sp.]MCM1172196.1 GPR endopeptidase [Clostridium sp.]MCM1209768.1 GPR endopeptidase [Ruminococcus sp.]
MDRFIRTDLAVELKEDLNNEDCLDGVNLSSYVEYGVNVSKITVKNKAGAKLLGKPIGNYITLENKELLQADESIHEQFLQVLYNNLEEMLQDAKNILVVGLGNRDVTPDALGPYVVDNLFITRHLIQEKLIKNTKILSAISPGVMAQTGVETLYILKGICKEVQPDAIIAVDALAAREPSRLNTTIQLCDTGISPGSGVGNHRLSLNEETLGVKVIAIGVPTVISVTSIISEAMEAMVNELSTREDKHYEMDFDDNEKFDLVSRLVSPELATMFVTPKNIDESVKRISYTISEAINSFIE